MYITEATSALDVDTERKLYQLLTTLDLTFVSVGHRQTIASYHSRIVRLDASGIREDSMPPQS